MPRAYACEVASSELDDDPDLDPQLLRLVKAIADEGSITAAADALGYSQPAVSQQLKRAEVRLGLALIERVGRGVRLTEAGRVLARHAPSVTSALDAAAGELAELQGLRSGRVRLVAFPSASPTIVPRLLARPGRAASRNHGDVRRGRAARGGAGGARRPRRHRVDVQLSRRPGGPARLERARTVGAGGGHRRSARGSAGRARGCGRGRAGCRPAGRRELDRRLSALPRSSAGALRPRGLRAADRLRDRQLRGRGGTCRAGHRGGDAARGWRWSRSRSSPGWSTVRCRRGSGARSTW